MPSPTTIYRLGCPVWGCPEWVGSLYSTANRRRWLAEYSSVFGTVEGNSTFYAMPPVENVRRWAKEAAPGFRFALKTPSAITHDKMLAGARSETDEWIERLRLLQAADRLGPTLLQLPPFFSGAQLDDLKRFLEAWPSDLLLAVEPRHEDYFAGGAIEDEFDALLREHAADRALFDSRALFHAPPDDPVERASQGRKPKLPRRLTVTADRPFLRFVARNELAKARPWIDEWAAIVAGWIGSGLQPYVFCHAPDDAHAPRFAAELHGAIRSHLQGLAPLPEWPGEAAPNSGRCFSPGSVRSWPRVIDPGLTSPASPLCASSG